MCFLLYLIKRKKALIYSDYVIKNSVNKKACLHGKSFCFTRLFYISCNLVVNFTFKYSNILYLKAFSYLRHILPWQTNNILIINENSPKISYSASICHSLPTINFTLRLLKISQIAQNAAKQSKLRQSNVVRIEIFYYCAYFIIVF